MQINIVRRITALMILATLSAISYAEQTIVSTASSAGYHVNAQVESGLRESCDWNQVLVNELADKAKGAVEISSNQASARKLLTLSTIAITAPRVEERRKNAIVVRAEITEAGKFIATREFRRDGTARASVPFCEGLRILGRELGIDIAAWIPTAKLVRTAPAAGYQATAEIDEEIRTNCDWNQGLVKKAVIESNGQIAIASEKFPHDLNLSISTLRMTAPRVEERRKNSILARAEISQDGKLLATRDFLVDDTARGSVSFCEGLRTLGEELGQDVADWVEKSKLPDCKNECSGIHPDQTTFISPEIGTASESLISEKAQQCEWPTKIVTTLVKLNNEDSEEPKARSLLKISPPNEPSGNTRRLRLTVEEMNFFGGNATADVAIGVVVGSVFGLVPIRQSQSIKITGELTEGDLIVGSFSLTQKENIPRLTGCSTLEAISDNISQKIHRWLKAPSIDSKL